MRIFERLRGRSRRGSNIERKLFEAITDGLLQRLEDESIIMPSFSKTKAVPVAGRSPRNASDGFVPAGDRRGLPGL